MRFYRSSLLLYAITQSLQERKGNLYKDIEEVLKNGATIIQLREKKIGDEEFLKEALEVKTLCNKYSVPFIVNDNVEIAIKSGADGIHVGQSDMNAKEAREKIGDKMILGVSVNEIDQAIEAENNGADYLGVGSVFITNTKSDASFVSLEKLKNICQAVDIPVVAIGGINENNILDLKESHIDGVAIVSAIFGAEDIAKATRRLLNLSKEIIRRDQ